MSQPMKKMFSLEIAKEDIPGFIGKRGESMKRYIITPSKREYFREMGVEKASDDQWRSLKLGVHIESEEKDGNERVVAKITVPDDKTAEFVRDNILKHQTIFLKKKSEPKKRTYYFNVNLRHNCLGKVIGSGGANINSLKEQIHQTEEDGLSPTKLPSIQVSEGDGRENMEVLEKNASGECLKLRVIVDNLSIEMVHSVVEEHMKQYVQEEVDFSGDGFEEWEREGGNGW